MRMYIGLPLVLTLAAACTTGGKQDSPAGDSQDDCEVCDGVDNDGDGLVDEDYADVDQDGIADCVDEDTEVCDGIDNNGDGNVDEGFGDADADGHADCLDPEDCDGLDNNGDGNVDEGYDGDGNGVADCFDELCNCIDDDGDGAVDEGLDCAYDVTLDASADDVMTVYLDGAMTGSGSGWSNLFSQTYALPSGVHHLAVEAGDTGGVIAGFNARVTVPGAGPTSYDTGTGAWLVTSTSPTTTYGTAWTTGAATTAMSPDDSFLASSCASIWSYSPSGGAWVWAADCTRWDLYRKNWFYLEVDVCPEAADPELCDGLDNDGDGDIDEGYVDSDFDGEADCIEVEECDGLDNDGDGDIDEGYADTDGDTIADCVDTEECDGLDNNGDGAVDEGYPDTDGDGTADCEDKEECDGLDNNGDGAVDEGYADTDGDGTADCMDSEECDGLDNNGDGQVDEGYPDTDSDGTADCIDTEDCDGLDNDGDGAVDEGYADTDGDGTADCIDTEECDGLDNDGDGTVDEGYADTDSDGTADCVDSEECDGQDNDGDGVVDEGYPDTDGDAMADCIDAEECDGLDNNGDGAVDEGYADTDGDGTADCMESDECDCADNDGDGQVDEDGTCSYNVTLKLSADDYWTAYFDGVSWGSGSSWSTLGTLSTTATAGDHAIAVYAYDGFRLAAGMNARVEVTGAAVDAWDTGLGLWLVSATNPSTQGASSTWTTTPYTGMAADNLYPARSSCTSRWGNGYSPSGGDWIWRANCADPVTYPANWFLLEFEVCPAAVP